MKTNKKDITLEGVDPSIVKDYACEDIDLTYQFVIDSLLAEFIRNLSQTTRIT